MTNLTQEEIYAALGLAMQRIEAAGASIELTSAVTIVGDVRQSIGNQWNKPDVYAAQHVRNALMEAAQVPKTVAQATGLVGPALALAEQLHAEGHTNLKLHCSWPQCGCAAGCGYPGEAERKARPTAEEQKQEHAAQLAEDRREESAERMRGLS